MPFGEAPDDKAEERFGSVTVEIEGINTNMVCVGY